MVVAHGAPVGERYRKADAVREHAQNNALALVHREGGAAARHPVDRVFWDDAAGGTTGNRVHGQLQGRRAALGGMKV